MTLPFRHLRTKAPGRIPFARKTGLFATSPNIDIISFMVFAPLVGSREGWHKCLTIYDYNKKIRIVKR